MRGWYGWSDYQVVYECDGCVHCLAIGVVGCDRSVRITREAGDVTRHFVLERADPAAHYGLIRAGWRPRESRARRRVVFAGNALVFESQAEIYTQSGSHKPAILNEAGVFVVMRHPQRPHAESDQLGERASGAQDSHWMRPVVQRIAHVVEIKAGFDLMRSTPELLLRSSVNLEKLNSRRAPIHGREVIALLHRRRQDLRRCSMPPNIRVKPLE